MTEPARREPAQGGQVPDEKTRGEQVQSQQAQGEAPQPAPARPEAAADRRVHILEVAANQRERVLGSFTDQRDSIVKAVADQRAAAMAPIDAVRARLAHSTLRPQPQPATMPAKSGVATEIVTTLKAMIAEEVRLQLQALLAPGPTTPTDTAPDPDQSLQP